MIEAQAGGGAPWSAYAQRLLAPESQLFRWPRPGGHDDKVRWRQHMGQLACAPFSCCYH